MMHPLEWIHSSKHCNMYNVNLQLLRDVKSMKQAVLSEEEGDLDVVILATKLSGVGYRVHLRSAIGGGAGTDCFRNLRNEFLIIEAEDVDGENYVVEAHFKDHFAIPHPTERYAGLLGVVPDEMVAPTSSITPLVQLLCSEMSLAFEAQGLSLPPWRHSKSLLSKWLPSKAQDFDMSTPGGSPRGGSPVSHAASLARISSGMVKSSDPDAPILQLRSSSSSGKTVRDADRNDQSHKQKSPTATPRGGSMKSLLSKNLAAITPLSTAEQKERSREQDATTTRSNEISEKSSHKGMHKTSSTASRNQEWSTRPIRRVRMQGAVAT